MRGQRTVPLRAASASHQRRLPFLERQSRLERRVKWTIAVATVLACAGLVAGTGIGRYAARRVASEAHLVLRRWAGLPPDRAAIEARRQLRRRREVEDARAIHRRVYARATPRLRRLLDFGGLGAEEAVLRWGNYNKILLLSSKVFVPDDTGRSYRMRPQTRAWWVQRIALGEGLSGFFLMPDGPELPALVEAVGAYLVPSSLQRTNSWGCRGPEPDPAAPLRGLILGDSNVQGIFLGEDETPPERLRVELGERLQTRVSLLNTGHLGYSPEQFFATLLEYAPRFRPHFVVFSFCPNDFGDVSGREADPDDLDEAKYWVDRIVGYCRDRKILVVATPIPYERQVTEQRLEGYYPGRICNILPIGSLFYCNPIEDFADEHLRLMTGPGSHRGRSAASPLFNGALDDWHMSAAGARVWAKALGRRLALVLEAARQRGELWFERGERP